MAIGQQKFELPIAVSSLVAAAAAATGAFFVGELKPIQIEHGFLFSSLFDVEGNNINKNINNNNKKYPIFEKITTQARPR